MADYQTYREQRELYVVELPANTNLIELENAIGEARESWLHIYGDDPFIENTITVESDDDHIRLVFKGVYTRVGGHL